MVIEDIFRLRLDGEKVAYFYCSGTGQNKIDPVEIFRSLLRQISWSCEDLSVCQAIKDLYDNKTVGSTNGKFTISDCVDLLKSLVRSTPRVWVIIDALDECSDYLLVLKNLKNWATDHVGIIKILVSSRESTGIHAFITKQSGFEANTQANSKDVQGFIEKELQERGDYLLDGQAKDLEATLKSALIKGAHGM